jgi:hypothetical protein
LVGPPGWPFAHFDYFAGSRAIISGGGVQVGQGFLSATIASPDHSNPARPTEMP